MLNPATHQHRDQLNSFTKTIADQWLHFSNKTFVRLRNGTVVQPLFTPAADDTCEDAFFTEEYSYCWNLDGTSVTSRDYDMMEIHLVSKGDFYTEHLERALNETTRAHTRLTQQLELALNELKQCEVDLFEAEDKFHVLSFYINDAQSLACAKDRTRWMSQASERVRETIKKIEEKQETT